MSDIIDLIRSKLVAAMDLPPAIDTVLMEVRMEYAGDTVYIRQPKVHDLIPTKRPARSRRNKGET